MSYYRFLWIVLVFLYFSEKLIVQMCDKMVAGGFRDAGYTYIALDDCWAEKRRDPLTGKLVPDRTRFPRGMKALADYVGLCYSLYYISMLTSQVLFEVTSYKYHINYLDQLNSFIPVKSRGGKGMYPGLVFFKMLFQV